MHRHYEELCALAATGQINTGDEADLHEHLSTCSECRAFLDDVAHVGMQGAPVVAASKALRARIQPPRGIRGRFLDRAAAAGLNLSPGPVLAESPKQGWRGDPVRNLLNVNSPPAWRVWQRIPPIQPLYAAMAFLLMAYLCLVLAGLADGNKRCRTRSADVERGTLEPEFIRNTRG